MAKFKSEAVIFGSLIFSGRGEWPTAPVVFWISEQEFMTVILDPWGNCVLLLTSLVQETPEWRLGKMLGRSRHTTPGRRAEFEAPPGGRE